MNRTVTGTVSVSNITSQLSVSDSEECVLNELNIRLCVDGKVIRTVVCTDTDIKELCYGIMFSDGFISSADDVKAFEISKERDEVFAVLNDRTAAKHTTHAKPAYFKAEWIFEIINAFGKRRGIHSVTAGTHSCLLAIGNDVIFTTEDISRHNAIDKAIGYMLINGIDPGECIMFTSGRVQKDVVSKVINAGINVLVSKSVPTMQAVELSKEKGLTLICRAWPDEIKIFSGEDRCLTDTAEKQTI
ncbi:MAG: formate dehydrogenase accessory sulfurtransferase FdhD [Lachnospiraceae bacterium]|nr:formate dehydrogenase accessory sulfurtransferase FdhD [Lachnospiraceae bacterium]